MDSGWRKSTGGEQGGSCVDSGSLWPALNWWGQAT